MELMKNTITHLHLKFIPGSNIQTHLQKHNR